MFQMIVCAFLPCKCVTVAPDKTLNFRQLSEIVTEVALLHVHGYCNGLHYTVQLLLLLCPRLPSTLCCEITIGPALFRANDVIVHEATTMREVTKP